MVWAMLYYLLDVEWDNQPKAVQDGILQLIRTAFISMDDINACKADGKNPAGRFNNANGALFHLLRISGHLVAGQKIADIEYQRPVKVLSLKSGKSVEVGEYDRRSDIVLADGKLIEVKSYIGKKKGIIVGHEAFSAWGGQGSRLPKDGGSPPMKEFFLDQVLIKDLTGGGDKLQWSFDSFRAEKGCPASGSSGFDRGVLEKVRDKMKKEPGWLKAHHTKAMFNIQTLASYKSTLSSMVSEVTDVFGVTDWLGSERIKQVLSAEEISNLNAAAEVFQ